MLTGFDNQKNQISIITKPPYIFFKGCIKYYIKKYVRSLLSISRGPDAVLSGLIRSMHYTDVSFNVNPLLKDLAPCVHVLSSPQALESIIKLKEAGKIKHILAGPNISILPTDDKGVISNKQVDVIVLPSEWTKAAYTISNPQIGSKIKIWPVGVEIPSVMQKDKTKEHYILLTKTAPEDLIRDIISSLNRKNVSYSILKYGNFKRNEYIAELQNASGVIYVQEVESQGVALQEAWGHDVPTLVWNKGSFTYPNTNITIEGNISAPYLTKSCGMFFKDISDFEEKITIFMQQISSFKAREYCIKNLSDETSGKIYLEILKSIE